MRKHLPNAVVACSVEGQRRGKVGSSGSRLAYSIIGPVRRNQLLIGRLNGSGWRLRRKGDGHMLGADGNLMVGNDGLDEVVVVA